MSGQHRRLFIGGGWTSERSPAGRTFLSAVLSGSYECVIVVCNKEIYDPSDPEGELEDTLQNEHPKVPVQSCHGSGNTALVLRSALAGGF